MLKIIQIPKKAYALILLSLKWYLIDSIWLGNTIHKFQGKWAQIQEYSGRVFVSSCQKLHVGENCILLRVFVTEILPLIISSFTIYVKHWTWILEKLSYLSQKFLQLWIQEYHLHVLVKRYELKINSCFSSNFHHQLAFCSDQVYFLPPSTDLKHSFPQKAIITSLFQLAFNMTFNLHLKPNPMVYHT